MPALQFLSTENEVMTNNSIPKGKALMLVYFRSDCDHCEHTAQQLKSMAAKYPAQIWMISAEPLETLRTFEEMVGLLDIDNLKVMQDGKQLMHRNFDFSKLPYIVLFNNKKVQVKIFGELPAASEVKRLLQSK
ncbi:MAG: thioredoxin-like domain-containing protein [Edaphocola sp.]